MLKDFYHLKRDNNPHREEAFTLSCLGKLYPASSADFLRCRGYLSDLLRESFTSSANFLKNSQISNKNINQDQILIIGLTESGIIPALLMYIETLVLNLNTNILYSTRRPLSGIPFKESHSHGPDHILPLLPLGVAGVSSSGGGYYSTTGEKLRFSEIWIVEDEITSGNTVCNLMVQLCEYLEISRVRIFAFADFRDSQQKSDFSIKTALHNIECTVHTLNIVDGFTGQMKGNITPETNNDKLLLHNIIPANNTGCLSHNIIPANNTRCLSHSIMPVNNTGQINNIEQKNNTNLKNTPKIESLNNWHFPEKRPALAMKSGNFLDSALWKFPPDKLSAEWRDSETVPERTILAVGEAIDLAACFALANENIRFQQISLSPWKIDNKSIFSRITFAGRYYLYNYENLKDAALNSVFILCDPIDRNIEQEAIIKLGECGIEVKPIFKSGRHVESELFEVSEQYSLESAFLSKS